MQELLYTQMPEHLRSPEALKLIMQDPDMEEMLRQNLQELDEVSARAMFDSSNRRKTISVAVFPVIEHLSCLALQHICTLCT